MEQRGWDLLLDVIHDGLAHALNGRLAGLDGIAQLTRIRGGLDAELMALLEDELTRLRELAEATAHVPRAARDLGSITTLAEAIAAAVAVNRIRRDLVLVVRPAAESAAVRARPDDVVRVLLLLIRALERAARAEQPATYARTTGGTPPGPRPRPSPGDQVVIELAEAARVEAACVVLRLADPEAAPDVTLLDEARDAVLSAGGTVESSDGGGAIELRLPRLELD